MHYQIKYFEYMTQLAEFLNNNRISKDRIICIRDETDGTNTLICLMYLG